MKTIKLILLMLLTIGILPGEAQNMTPETLFKLGRVSEPQLSPDGKVIVYNIRTYNLQSNKGNSDIYRINVDGSARVLLAGDSANETAARWSADGSKIFYLSNKTGSTQLWRMDANGDNKIQVSNYSSDISNYGMSAHEAMLWFTTDVKIDKTTQDIYPDLPKATGRIIDNLMYRHWDEWADGTYSHVFMAAYKDGKMLNESVRDMMQGERFDCPMKPHGGEEQITWSHEEKRIAYTCKKLSGKDYATTTNSDIYVTNIINGSTDNISEGMMGYDVNPRFSPDGHKILWMSMKTAGYEADRNRLFLYDFDSKTKKELTEGFKYSVEKAEWSPDGKVIYFLAGINATEQVYSLTMEANGKNTIKQITNDNADHTDFSLVNNGHENVMVTSMMSISLPTELFNINLTTGAATQITYTNRDVLSKIKMGKVEKRMVKATDGKDILTWVIYPPDFDATKKYPALLYCQGGPQSTVSQFFSYRWNFQLMAANGYIIVAPNRRGLPSFGEEWNAEISGDWGGQAMKDLLSAIDDVSKETFINKEKLGAVGASFGGYTVYWLMGHHNKRFKTFIAHDGVFDLTSMYGTTEELWFPDYDLGGPYWKTPMPESYAKFSPHNFVKYWDTPILIIHNEKDFRVPVEQGMEAFTAAQLKNIPSRFLCFPDENHWVLKPQNSVLWQRIFFDWLGRTLK